MVTYNFRLCYQRARFLQSVILPAVDRFSKSGHFVFLDKLSSTSENTKLFVAHVFRLHRLHKVSDRGPQFTSEVWKTFCTSLGAKVSLSTGYHRLSSGQTESCRHVWTWTLEALLRTADGQRCYGDRLRRPNPKYAPGLAARGIPLKSRKLAPCYIGSY